jgi:hypothetical protein
MLLFQVLVKIRGTEFKTSVCYALQVTSIKSLTLLEKEIEKKNVSCGDLEFGKSRDPKIVMVSNLHEKEMEEIIDSYRQHSEEVLDKIHDQNDQNELKFQGVLSLTTIESTVKRQKLENRLSG